MIISFFTGGQFATGVDYSKHPDLVYQGEINDDFDFSRFVPRLKQDGENYEIITEELPPPSESDKEKFARIFAYFSNPKNPLEAEKLEGMEFNNKQIGDLIQARVFEGNPHAESAMQAKFSAWIASVMLKKPNNELKAEIDAKQAKINEVREFFGLTPLTF